MINFESERILVTEVKVDDDKVALIEYRASLRKRMENSRHHNDNLYISKNIYHVILKIQQTTGDYLLSFHRLIHIHTERSNCSVALHSEVPCRALACVLW
jgi:hypothetical protein